MLYAIISFLPVLEFEDEFEETGTAYMKPAPPVTKIFFVSGKGSKLVVPTRIGACFHSSAVT